MKLFRIFPLMLIFVLTLYIVTVSAQAQQTSTGSAQQTPDPLKKYNISFPVKELGGCSSLGECRSFCEDPLNHQACIDFAKNKGFYRGDQLKQKQQAALSQASAELGCNSDATCKEFCQSKENQQKCSQFAQNYSLTRGIQKDANQQIILQKATQVLGCNSIDTCSNYCAREANKQKCHDFAKDTGLNGGTHRVGPGNCQSEKTCQTYCSDPNHFKECQQYGPPPATSRDKPGFRGPGGCDSESSCRAFCANHPADCPGFHPGARPSPGSSKFYPPPQGSFYPSNSSGGNKYSPYPNPPDQQKQYCLRTGCSWVGSSCQCGNNPYSSGFPKPTNYPGNYPPSSYSPAPSSSNNPPGGSPSNSGGGTSPPGSPTSCDFACQCSRSGGTWTGTTCAPRH